MREQTYERLKRLASNIPNLLSIFRIVLIPFFIWQMLVGNTWNAGVILILSGFTDMFDGMLARRFGWITELGKVLDPVADKMTQISVSLVLLYVMRQYWVFFIIIITKEFMVMMICGMLLKRKVEFKGALWFGKISTTIYYVAMVMIIFWPGMLEFQLLLLLTVTTLCSLVSAIMYIPVFIRAVLRKNTNIV